MSRTGVEAKPPWEKVPHTVRAEAERVLGSRIVRAQRAYGGYAPSATFRLGLDDGRRAFFKGSYPLPEGSAVEWVLHNEVPVYSRLGRWIRPWAPEYLGSIRTAGWQALLLEDVGGESVLPWTASKARRATRSYASFHARSHGRRLPGWLARDRHHRFGVFWAAIARERGGLDRVSRVAGPRAGEARAWLTNAVPILRRAERGVARAAEPFVLMHFDTRSDNLRLQGDLLRIFDWPFASVGPHEFDLAAFAQSVAAEGGPAPDRIAAWYEEEVPLRPAVLRASTAGIAGYFTDRAPRPPMTGLPRIRSIQRRQLKASLPWAASLLGLPRPDWIEAVPD
jgi:hypothetical protein